MAYNDNLDAASEKFLNIPRPLPDDLPPHIFLATGGLLFFRSGDIAGGRKYYEAAYQKAPRSRKLDVQLYWAREEIRLNDTDRREWIDKVLSSEAPKDSIYASRFQQMLRTEQKKNISSVAFPENSIACKGTLDEIKSACELLKYQS